jgi:hypothetical protein
LVTETGAADGGRGINIGLGNWSGGDIIGAVHVSLPS